MKRYILTVTVFALGFLLMNGQTKKKTSAKIKYVPIVQAGILEGQSDKTYGQFQLVNGIQRNAWFYGLGLGIDYYGPKRVPLFLDVRRDLVNGTFAYADAGYNFAWLRENEKIDFWGTDYKSIGGLYYETGLGYKFMLKNKIAVGFSAGYSFKQQKETYKATQFFVPPFIPGTERKQPSDIYDYKFRRISLKFNCSF